MPKLRFVGRWKSTCRTCVSYSAPTALASWLPQSRVVVCLFEFPLQQRNRWVALPRNGVHPAQVTFEIIVRWFKSCSTLRRGNHYRQTTRLCGKSHKTLTVTWEKRFWCLKRWKCRSAYPRVSRSCLHFMMRDLTIITRGILSGPVAIAKPDWETYCNKVGDMIIQDQSPSRVMEVRSKLYELLSHCIPPTVILKVSWCDYLTIMKRRFHSLFDLHSPRQSRIAS